MRLKAQHFLIAIFLSLGSSACVKILGDFTSVALEAGTAPVVDSSPVPSEEAGPVGGSCTTGQTSCQGTERDRFICNADSKWERDQTCPYLCRDGNCKGECTPGNAHCNGKIPSICDREATWPTGAQPCTYACAHGQGKGCFGDCNPDDKRCSPDGRPVLQTCSVEAKWIQAATCPYVCTGTGTDASCGGECVPSAQLANDGGPPGGAANDAALGSEGGTGSRRCLDNEAQYCNPSGRWITDAFCENVCNVGGKCGGTCEPNTKRCNGLTPRTCSSAGLWVDAPGACPYACDDTLGCVGECTPGAKQCVGDTLSTCESNGFYGTTLFPCTYICNPATAACAGECKPGALQCNSGVPEKCNPKAQWERLSVAECTFGCFNGVCGICFPGDKRCLPAGNSEICNETGKWVPNGACPAGCNADAGVCNAGAR